MNAKQERKERSRSTILDSAGRLLRARGIVGARVADVMQGAGLTVGGFYAHFASKDELVSAALHRLGAEYRDRLFNRIEEKPEGDRVAEILKRYLSAAHRDAADQGCPFPSIVGEIGTTAPEQRDALAKELAALIERLESLIPQAQGHKTRTVAIGLLALMIGGLSVSRALRGTALSDEVIRACRLFGVAATRGLDL
jgi:TetR/AcrR family transcriptional repressor of nem operon